MTETTFDANDETTYGCTILELLDATAHVDHYDSVLDSYVTIYGLHVWNYERNQCEHVEVSVVDAVGTVAIPDYIIDAWNHPRHQARTTNWQKINR